MTQVNSSVVDDILNKLPKKYKKKILEEELPFSIEYNPKNIGDKYILLRDFGHIIEISWRKRTEDKVAAYWIDYSGEYNPSYYSFDLNYDTNRYELSYFEFTKDSKYHRENGPARVWAKEKRSTYYINGERFYFKTASYVILDIITENDGSSYYKILTANEIKKLPYLKWMINDKGFFTYES